MTFSKFIRKANRVLREARKYRKMVILAMGLLMVGITYCLSEGVVVGGKTLLEPSGFLEEIELLTVDKRFSWRNRSPMPPHPSIALVGITQSSLDQGSITGSLEEVEKAEAEKTQAGQPVPIPYSNALKLMTGGTWPLPRAVYPYVIERLFELGAKVIALDVLFIAQREGDEDFAAVLKKYPGRIVLASSKSVVEDENTGKKSNQMLIPNSVLAGGLGEDGFGFAYFLKDPDGRVRRLERTTSKMKESDLGHLQTGPDDWIHFAHLAVQKFTGRPTEPGREIVNYRGGSGTHPVYPLEEIFVDRYVKTDPRYKGGEVFKDKIVFIGAIAETMKDVHKTPLGDQPGVELFAHIAGAQLDQIPIREFPQKYTMALIVGMVVLAALLAFTVERVLVRFLAGAFGALAYLAATYFIFVYQRTMVPMFLPLVGFVLEGGLITLFDFAVEQIERAHVKSVLDKYVSSNVANLVVNQGDSFEQALRGQTKPVSVLFSDIRGFTTLSESRSPETLVSQLNEYFLPMVDKVLVEGGTLQKFIGDAIMAVWGDTHSLGLETDCAHAVRAALKMRTALSMLNEGWKGRDDRLELSIGVGINHGTVVVGELGHPQRMEFTVLGDGVNLAARLESATKQFGCDILVGETAEALTRNQFVFRQVDRAVFKGKTQPITVFTPLGEVGMEVPGWLTRYQQALELYYGQKFEEAKAQMEVVNGELGGDDFICKMYKKRCDHYLKEPPGADWNGAWVLSEK